MSLILARARRVVVSAAAASSSSSPLARAAARTSARGLATLFAEEDKAFHVMNLLEAKKKSKLTFTEIAERTGLTNAYVAQLFYRQAQLKKETVPKLKAAVPALSKDDLEVMQEIPFRSYHRDIIRTEPLIYRLEEAMLHYGTGIKAIVNETFGDGIMSAIDVYIDVGKHKGKFGEDRVRITLDGKFLPHIEQSVGPGAAPASKGTASAAAGSSSSSGEGLVKKGGGRGRAAKKGGSPVGLMSSLSTLSGPVARGAADSAAPADGAKRGRGRPRKQPASASAPLSTRPAGRTTRKGEEQVLQAAPTKIVVTAVAAEGEGAAGEKRGRGRPRGVGKGMAAPAAAAAAQIWV